jgi:hypothetical protein
VENRLQKKKKKFKGWESKQQELIPTEDMQKTEACLFFRFTEDSKQKLGKELKMAVEIQ